MNYLLDTHTLIWFLKGTDELSEKTVKIIENSDAIIYVSIATIWELSIKISLGKFNFPNGIEGFIKLVEDNGFEILPITINDTIKICSLEYIHRDPFDRIMIAQSLENNLIIITKDSHIKKYNVKTLW